MKFAMGLDFNVCAETISKTIHVMFQFTCLYCWAEIAVEQKVGGLVVKCPSCGRELMVPSLLETAGSNTPVHSQDMAAFRDCRSREMKPRKGVLRLAAFVVSIVAVGIVALVLCIHIRHIEAERNPTDAFHQALLARAYCFGTDSKMENREAAEFWAKKSAAQKHPLGLFMLGIVTKRNLSIVREIRESEAKSYFAEAIHEGFITRANDGGRQWIALLGNAYFDGYGVPRNDVEAVRLFTKSADLGDALAMDDLGACYTFGSGVPKDESEAVKWFSASAALGDPTGVARLGFHYRIGAGVPKDEAKGVELLQKAADSGNAWGMTNLGVCYGEGLGVAKDEREALKWYRKAADLCESQGMAKLGTLYLTGSGGVAKDEEEAVKWFSKAAEIGDAFGTYFLAHCYLEGIGGVQKNREKAVMLFRRAADLGQKDAKDCLRKLGQE